MMTVTLVVIPLCLWLATWLVRGFSVYILCVLVSTLMFASRRIGIQVQFNTILTCEILPFGITTILNLLFKTFTWKVFLLTLLLRVIFIGVVVYDSKAFVYFTEERKVRQDDDRET